MKLFAGSSNIDFAQKVAFNLKSKLCNTNLTHFRDGEVKIIISENVRGEDCFIIQSTCRSIHRDLITKSIPSVNDNIMELFILVDALKRGSAKSVNLVIPYFGYQRQDRKDYSRAPISASVIARCIETLNVNRVMIYDLHAAQISGFFSNNCPIDNLYAEPYFIKQIKSIIDNSSLKENIIFVSPDAGAMKTNYRVAQKFNSPTGTIFKNRTNGVIDHMMLIGDVKDKIVFMIDDMIDTGGTICNATKLLKEKGALNIYIFVTHALFSGDAIKNIYNSPIDKVYITNTVPNYEEILNKEKIEEIDVSWMCSEAITRLIEGESISHLYNDYDYFLSKINPKAELNLSL